MPKALGCRLGAGQPCSQGRSGGKLLSAERKWRCVAAACQRHGLSERRACAAFKTKIDADEIDPDDDSDEVSDASGGDANRG